MKIKNDIILIAGVLALVLTSLLFFAIFNKEGDLVTVRLDGTETARYNLSEDIEVELFSDDSFSNVLVIKDGKAYMKTANCPDKVCVGHRPISKSGQTIVCLPHKLVVSVQRAEEKAPDIVV